MSGQPQRHYSVDDYFVVEETATTKHEYYNGEIFAMAGASLEHNHISANILAVLRLALRGTGCSAFGSDLRMLTPSGLYTYPDVSVICGKVQLDPGRPDTATNPMVLVEVLSDATRDYDRGEKFALYKAIPTLREYLLIEQSRPLVERFKRQRQGLWAHRSVTALNGTVSLASVRVDLPLREIYREVF